ncbi:hypothetical protein GCM10025867_37780 [Frondihabitans sucicola]|uniref:LysM domain-containing protein n=1 Tax=Frondihabitans sucicola TaxID=1268041 RepID=A0ABM8GSU3_9MICO|nr:hypothetical protein GCM10025867_37780 [Frondihabitans sucicola]
MTVQGHPAATADSTDDFLARSASGDQVAFAALYDCTIPRVLGIITAVLRDPAQSEEVAQEVYLEVWQHAPRFDSAKGHATTVIFTLARRRAIDRVRASQASRDRDLTVGIRDREQPFDHVAETVETSLEYQRVRRAMERITPAQRRVIELVHDEYLDQAAVAERLGIKVGTVKTRLRDGLIALRRELTTSDEPEEASSPRTCGSDAVEVRPSWPSRAWRPPPSTKPTHRFWPRKRDEKCCGQRLGFLFGGKMSHTRARSRANSLPRSVRRRGLAAVGLAGAVVILLTGCISIGHGADSISKRHHSASARPTATASDSASASADPGPESGSASAEPVAPDPANSRPATPEPVATPVPRPTLTAVPRGTVVAEGDVASPKGSIHFHYRMVADGDNTYSAQYSGFTSTLPVPVSATLIDIAPKVGDGLTYHGVGDHRLGGPTTTAAPTSTASLGGSGQPSYLGTLVTYSSAPSESGVPTEIGPNKVLAVTSIRWSIPVRQSNVHPVDHGTRPYAAGALTATTARGTPKQYRVATGDTTAEVAARFGISTEDLIWLNANLEVFGDQQYLYASTTLNLDPDSL